MVENTDRKHQLPEQCSGPLFLTWFNFNHENVITSIIKYGMILFIHSKLQRRNTLSLGMDNKFHSTLYLTCDYLSMLWLKLIHVSKRDPMCLYEWGKLSQVMYICVCIVYECWPCEVILTKRGKGPETHDTKLFHFIVLWGALSYIHRPKMC